jgi:hypothetical protein
MVSDAPESFADLDGHCCDIDDAVNFVVGLANAYGSDNFAGAGRQDQSTLAGKIGAALGDTAATIQGALEVAGGGAGEVGGTSLILTGAGAPVGVAIDVGSAAIIAHGGATATAGAGHLAAAAGDAINSAIESRSSSGPKANDAPGVTAGGQATNEHGQKLGPSGKPQVNNVENTTKERASNAANKGSGVVSDPNPTRGEPHFHTKRGTGKKKRDGTHYNYPN